MRTALFTGGLRLETKSLYFNYSWPFATLFISPECLMVSTPFKSYKIPPDKIVKISEYNGLFSAGLQIVHSEEKAPEFLVFWYFNRTALFQALKEHGYDVFQQP